MKIFTQCIVCVKELGHPSFEPIFVAFDDNLIASGTCSRGHKFNNVLQANKFEIFMDCGADAIIKEYPLEACFNFAMARENLFLFAVEIMLDETQQDDYLKIIKKQSERILGAFSALYFINFQKVFKFDKKQSGIKDDIVKFRNDLVHQGKIPTLLEANAYGEAIYNEMDEIIQNLQTKYKSRIHNHTMNKLRSKYEKSDFDNCSTQSCTMMYSLSTENTKKMTFTEKLIEFKKMQSLITGSIPDMKALFAQISKQIGK